MAYNLELCNELHNIRFLLVHHHDQFHCIKRANRVFVWITIFYLMFIPFIPFSTSLLGEYHDQQISVVVYVINLAMAAFWTYVQWRYAAKEHRLIDPDLYPTFITVMSRRSLICPSIYLIAVALSFVGIQLSLVLFMAIPIYYLVLAWCRLERISLGFGLPEISK
jgi:uncharacterized membrane protein